MTEEWAIGPYIGVARVGNSAQEFYLEPDGVGALPIACDREGNPRLSKDGSYERVVDFKEAGNNGFILRQAARFRVFRFDKDQKKWVLPEPGEIEEITWTVHLANKKSSWYEFYEYYGNQLLGAHNSYAKTNIPLRNPDVANRKSLIIDPGPRSVSAPGVHRHFNREEAGEYAHASFPAAADVTEGVCIDTLGEMFMNANRELVVLGGFGDTGGKKDITNFTGASSWHDDIADGPVSCVIKVGRDVLKLKAWCLVGSPKVAPEIVNIVTLADTMQDVAIRNLAMRPDVYHDGAFDKKYRPDFDREIKPILERPAAYRWVANVPVLASVSPPPFDPRDDGPSSAPLRDVYLGLFRPPGRMPGQAISPHAGSLWMPPSSPGGPPLGNFPMMPLNSGSNSVTNSPGAIDKFLTLTETQYFMLQQWAAGKFVAGPVPAHPQPMPDFDPDPLALTLASMGNCVGGPFCPGIEVTWNTRNPKIYEKPLRIAHRRDDYCGTGLDPGYDETDDQATGCEPGDLTKRMAVPWQADFKECMAQHVNFTDPKKNRDEGPPDIPLPPAYYAHWWPPQSPVEVITGEYIQESNNTVGTPAGMPVAYARGIHTFHDLVVGWKYLGFVLNRSDGPLRSMFPNFVEQHRAHDKFDRVDVIPDPADLPAGRSKVVGRGKRGGSADGVDKPEYDSTWLLRPPHVATTPIPALPVDANDKP